MASTIDSTLGAGLTTHVNVSKTELKAAFDVAASEIGKLEDGGFEDVSGTGVLCVTSAGTTSVTRTITGTSAEITVTNGLGVSGDPTISLPSALTFTGKTITFAGGSFTNYLDEDNMASDSATAVASQQSIKAYIATQVTTALTQEQVEDFAGALVATGGTKTGIAVTYQDSSGDMDFVVATAGLTTSGIIEIATTAEVNTGSDDTRAVSPVGLTAWTGDTALVTVGTITTGVWTGTDVAVAAGGTGSSTASGARTNLGAIATVVEDSTPQLGGFLDTNSKFISHAQGANIASVAGDTNIWANFDGNTVHITGTNAITDFGTPKSAGDSMWVIFDAAASVVDSATITVAGNTNYQAAANDLALVYALTTSTFLFMPFPNSGASPVASSGGDVFKGVVAKTATYTVVGDDDDYVLTMDASGGARTFNLTAAATVGDGFVITLKKIDSSSNAVTVDANSSETIDGALTVTLSTQYETTTLICDGSNWHTVLASTPGGSVTVDNYEDSTDYTAGSTTALTLSVTPASENSITVTFDGVMQHHDTYSLSGAVVTFDTAIPTGTSDVEITTIASLDIGVPGDNTVGYDQLTHLGTATHVLTSNGTGSAPSYQANVPGDNTVGYDQLAHIGTATQILTSNGSGSAPSYQDPAVDIGLVIALGA